MLPSVALRNSIDSGRRSVPFQLQQVEGIEERLGFVPPPAEHMNGGHALLIAAHHLTVDRTLRWSRPRQRGGSGQPSHCPAGLAGGCQGRGEPSAGASCLVSLGEGLSGITEVRVAEVALMLRCGMFLVANRFV
jgi:hypothetical protein